ncbi:hypothetical protein SCUP234_01114 [Seiridium cupressi]
MASSTQPQIAIIGAGPAGLTLGVLLHQADIPFTIYDLRSKPTDEEFEQVSGMLNLNQNTGLPAIQASKLYDEFLSLTGDCSEADRIADKEGKILHSDEGGGVMPEISRHALTKMLISHIPADRILWEHKLLKASPRGSNTSQQELDFGPHGIHTADLVIGADGAWSRIRSLLSEKKPFYSGFTFITLTITDLDTRFPHLAELVGQGTFAAPGDGNVVMCQRGARRSTRIYLAVNTAEGEFGALSGLKAATSTDAKEKLLAIDTSERRWKMFGTFGPKLQELIVRGLEEQSGPLDIKPLYMLPVGQLEWKHKAGVTLIGDAAHLMTPFAGEGVNLAMKDALDLSEAIKEAWDEVIKGTGSEAFTSILERKLPGVEANLFERSEETAEETWNNLNLFISADAAPKIAAMFAAHFPQPKRGTVTLALIAPAHAGLRFGCSSLTIQRLDPVEEPGRKPCARLHHIVGGNALNATMLGDVCERGTCTTCQMSEDISNYLTAVLYFKHENGSYHRVPVTNNAALATGASGEMSIYYTQHDFWNDDVKTMPITPYPPEFRMTVGSPKTNTLDQAKVHIGLRYNCRKTTVDRGPECWDAKDLDSREDQSHMYSIITQYDFNNAPPCPAFHPVRMPQVTYETVWDTTKFDSIWPSGGPNPFAWSFEGSSGYGTHADYMFG